MKKEKMSIKANFIIPSWKYWTEPTRAQPLTQLYLATILENEGHKVEMTDLRREHKSLKLQDESCGTQSLYPLEIVNNRLPKADAYFHSVASPDVEETKKIIKDNPGIHIAGGPHVNIFPTKSGEIFDVIAIGKGEESIKQIAKDIEKDDLKKIYFMEANETYPFPQRHFLPKDKIVTSLFKTQDIPSTTVLFSHGCPMFCTFCANYNRSTIQRRSLESIEKEIDYLVEEYDIKGLSLQDEICIPPRKNDAIEFLDLMKRKGLVWRGQTRAGVPEDIIERTAQSGCLELSLGLESVDPHVLKLSKKGIKVETAEKSLALCGKYGIKTRLYLLNGLPGEPENIADKTMQFLDRTNPDVVLLSTLQPYPGSEIYNHPERFGMKITNKDFSTYNHLRCRFKDSNDNVEDAIPFEYCDGKGLSRKQIMNNLVTLQSYLRERGMNK